MSLALLFIPSSLAHGGGGNGMDMSMDGSMQLGQGNMLPYLHFKPGDLLWFLGWVPSSAAAMVGSCLALFLLALVERWIAASRTVMEVHWNKRAQIALSNKRNTSRLGTEAASANAKHFLPTIRIHLPPFIPAHDIPRGILYVGQTAISFAFMLSVMTFQVSFILAIVVGLGVGETLFGRYATLAAHLS